MSLTTIREIQGSGLTSPLAGRPVRTHGVVTGATRKGFFLQETEAPRDEERSCGIFVYSSTEKPHRGALVEVEGTVVDFVDGEEDRPTTQLAATKTTLREERVPVVEPVWLTAAFVDVSNEELARRLNRLEGMLVGVEAGATFIAPSNPFGDYVLLPAGSSAPRTSAGGVRIDASRPQRWLPGFRILEYGHAPVANVGSELLAPIVGPLNYRSASYQIATVGPVRLRLAAHAWTPTRLSSDEDHLSVLTLNGFNLDPWVEDPRRVEDPRHDVDDDVGDGRYDMLGEAIVKGAASPDIVALQEMQDDDGAELSAQVSAARNYATLIAAVRAAGGPAYRWVDIAPEVGADGGQPGGNIRNGFLYDETRVALVEGSVRRLGADEPAYEGSRKPLVARFRHLRSGRELVVLNVHLASKRHQHSIFAPQKPGWDPREELRVRQGEILRRTLRKLAAESVDYYLTGDFNDHEFSPTLRAILGDESANLLELLPEQDRYDYNHRGISQALMHGIVARTRQGVEYEALHGNELRGVQPGEMGTKATDHAYVIARLRMPPPAST